MPQSVRSVQPPLAFIPTVYRPWVIRVVHWTLPLLLRVRLRPWLPVGIRRIEIDHVERLVDLYAQFEAGKARFLMAVRHVEVDDPLSGLYLCSRAVARSAKSKGISLSQPVHTHFIYERGMTIWAGKTIGWLLSRIGGVPIRRGRRPDWVGLKAARKLMVEGTMPLVVAPEGATNGHSEKLGPLEPGVAQMGFWCAEDLQQGHRSEAVFIVPIGIQYRYVQPNWPRLAKLLSRLEAQSGIAHAKNESSTIDKACYSRILRLGAHLIATMETFYSRCYHQRFESSKVDEAETGSSEVTESKSAESKSAESQTANSQTANSQAARGSNLKNPAMIEAETEESLSAEVCFDRLQQLLNGSLQVAEQFFNLPAKGTLVDRCRRLEEASWNYIYRDDLPDLAELSPLERGLADWAAQEASLRELHMRIVETFVAVDGCYLREKPSFERCAETTLLMSDMLARLAGDKLPGRPRLGDRWVKITVQPPIAVTPRLADYQQNRRAGRTAVATLTEEIRQALEETIEY